MGSIFGRGVQNSQRSTTCFEGMFQGTAPLAGAIKMPEIL